MITRYAHTHQVSEQKPREANGKKKRIKRKGKMKYDIGYYGRRLKTDKIKEEAKSSQPAHI